MRWAPRPSHPNPAPGVPIPTGGALSKHTGSASACPHRPQHAGSTGMGGLNPTDCISQEKGPGVREPGGRGIGRHTGREKSLPLLAAR